MCRCRLQAAAERWNAAALFANRKKPSVQAGDNER
jgi:hypothetical protein